MIKHKCIAVLIVVLILTSLVSCTSRVPLASDNMGTTLPTQVSTIMPSNASDTMEPQMQIPLADESTESVKLAKQDLAQRLGISVDSVTVAAVIGQEFSADTFNCRTSKEMIAKEDPLQVVSGQSILLSASGRRYEYHASGQTVIFCRLLP